MGIIIRYSMKQPRRWIIKNFNNSKLVILKIINKLVELILETDFSYKFGGPDCLIQIYEAMLDYKYKSHRRHIPTNISDTITIIEFQSIIIKIFAEALFWKKVSYKPSNMINDMDKPTWLCCGRSKWKEWLCLYTYVSILP